MKALVQNDAISWGLMLLSVMLLIYLATFGTTIMLYSLFTVMLIVVSVVLSEVGGLFKFDEEISESEGEGMLKWTVISFAVILVLNLLTVYRFPLSITPLSTAFGNLSGTDSFIVPRMYGVIEGIAESLLFQGLILNFLISRTTSTIGIFLDGFLGGVYHSAQYGYSLPLIFISAGAFTVLALAAWETKRNSTPTVPHAIVNAIA